MSQWKCLTKNVSIKLSRDCLKAYLLVFMPLDIADGNMHVECQQWHFEFYALLPYEIFTFFLLFESQVLYFSFILRLMMILSLVIFQLPPQIDDTWRWRREQANLADFCTFWNFHTIMWRERGIWMVCVYVVHGKKRAREGCNFSPTHHFSSGKL